MTTSKKEVVERLRSSILEMIEADNLTVDELSKKMHVSKSHLHRIVKKNTGASTSLFIRKVKLKMASDLLRHTQRSISDIAYHCGFSRPQLLSRYFQETHGISPSAYRAGAIQRQPDIVDIPSSNKAHIKNAPLDISSISKSIVIMPFTDKSESLDQNFLCAGISDEIVYRLSQFPNLKITGRATADYLTAMSLKPAEIGNKLRADFVLHGSIKRSGGVVRINVALESIQDDELIWAERYEKELRSLFELEDEIAKQIVQRMKVALMVKGSTAVHQSKYEHAQAYEAYLKGREAFEKRKDLDIALHYFNIAIQDDPSFAKAHIGIAYVHFYKCIFAGAPPLQSWGAIQSAYECAMSIDMDIPEAFIVKGWIEFYFKNSTKKALKAMDQAIAIQPNLMDAYRIKAYFLCFSGHFEEGVLLAKKAFDMDPLGFNAWFSFGDILRRARRYTDSKRILKQLLLEYPNDLIAQEVLGYCYLYSGESIEAKQYFPKPSETPKQISLYVLGTYIYNFNHGDKTYIPTLLEELSKSDTWVQPTILSLLNFYIGDEKQAVDHLGHAKRDIDFGLKHILADQHWDPYRDHPEVQNVLRATGMVH